MTRKEIETRVEAEVGGRWADFEALHPALAAELGREDYVAAAMEQLRAEPAYAEAIRNGTVAGVAADAVGPMIERVIGLLMRL